MAVFDSIEQYIKHCIDNGYYVELSFDEYDIPNRRAYKKYHFFHHNMIYGYDDTGKQYMIAGYSDKPVYDELSYNIVHNARVDVNADIIRIKRNKNKRMYQFDNCRFESMLSNFINGDNQTGNEDYVYGINVLDELINTTRGQELLFSDIRVSYILYEHSALMQERLKFMIEQEVIICDCDVQHKLIEQCSKMANLARSVNLMVYRLINEPNTFDEKKIIKEVCMLQEIAGLFYSGLYSNIVS